MRNLIDRLALEFCFQRGQTYLVKVVKVVLAVAAARVGSSGSLVVSKTIAPAYVSRISDTLRDIELQQIPLYCPMAASKLPFFSLRV